MKDYLLYVPSRGRPYGDTVKCLSAGGLTARMRLVIREEEVPLYAEPSTRVDGGFYTPHGVRILTTSAQTITQTRQWIVDQHDTSLYGAFICMLDDDLKFYRRSAVDPSKFLALDSSTEHAEMFDALHDAWNFDKYAHVGILPREGAHILTENAECIRNMRLLCYDVEVLREKAILFRTSGREDFDVQLQLIKAGYKNLALYRWCHNQKGSGLVGGVSDYLTLSDRSSMCQELKDFHPDLVEIVEKHTKTAWGGQSRLDVRIAWKKAYTLYGRRNHVSPDVSG